MAKEVDRGLSDEERWVVDLLARALGVFGPIADSEKDANEFQRLVQAAQNHVLARAGRREWLRYDDGPGEKPEGEA